MNPIFLWVIAHTVGGLSVRTCPACHRLQLVPKAKRGEEVTCKACGRAIASPPPPGTAAR